MPGYVATPESEALSTSLLLLFLIQRKEARVGNCRITELLRLEGTTVGPLVQAPAPATSSPQEGNCELHVSMSELSEKAMGITHSYVQV